MPFSEDNNRLANTCQLKKAACCRTGKIFIPKAQYELIVFWLKSHSSNEDLCEFQERCKKYPTFLLYDQKSCCQFLDGNSMCRLHEGGAKPLECFWWPFHIYVDSQERLLIGAANYCCGGCQSGDVTDHLRKIEQQAAQVGRKVIRTFRNVFPGTKKYRTVKMLDD